MSTKQQKKASRQIVTRAVSNLPIARPSDKQNREWAAVHFEEIEEAYYKKKTITRAEHLSLLVQLRELEESWERTKEMQKQTILMENIAGTLSDMVPEQIPPTKL